MKTILDLFLVLYCRFVQLIAYGPWGASIHRVFIRVFKFVFGITDEVLPSHKRLGDFFLRDTDCFFQNAELVSPVEANVMLSAQQANSDTSLEIKGQRYVFKDFPEFQNEGVLDLVFWNFYLSPKNYHWFHLPSEALNIEAMRVSGRQLPVNAFGRFLSPILYQENERLSFRWELPGGGRAWLLNVGAVGVSGILSSLGDVPFLQWKKMKDRLSKGSRLGGFQLGSSSLLVLEKAVIQGLKIKPLGNQVKLGEALLQEDA